MLLTVLSFILVIGVLIFVHELGHFLAAKALGVQVIRFSLGIGPAIRALSFRRGETEYCLSWLPLGGYVSMATLEEQGPAQSLEGVYTVGFRALDTSVNGPGGGPIHVPSDVLYLNFYAVPEPSVLAMAGVGVMGMLWMARRRSAKAMEAGVSEFVSRSLTPPCIR